MCVRVRNSVSMADGMTASSCVGCLQVMEDLERSGLEPNEFTLAMALQACNVKGEGKHEVCVCGCVWCHVEGTTC